MHHVRTVSLDRCDVLPVEVEVNVGEVGRRTAVNDHFVQNEQTRRRFSGFACGVVFT